jgi:hypothetical protein
MKLSMVIVALFLALVVVSAQAGLNPAAKVAVHVKAHNAKQTCGAMPVIEGCGDIVTTYAGSNFDAFPVFFDLAEYAGIEYGFCWPDWTYSASWTQCADLVIGEISGPGDGVSQTWFSCHNEAIVIPGWAWLYADGPGRVVVCGFPAHGKIYALDCDMVMDEVTTSFAAGVYGEEGTDPCVPVSIAPTTWSAIKGMFE